MATEKHERERLKAGYGEVEVKTRDKVVRFTESLCKIRLSAIANFHA